MIQQISIKGLFGHLTYTLPQTGQLQEAVILYGENGTGKTTILRLVYHMLSPAHNGGHRTEISKVPFSSLSIQLEGAIEVRATRTPGILVGPCLLQFFQNNELVAEWDYVPGAKSLPTSSPELFYAMNQMIERSSSTNRGSGKAIRDLQEWIETRDKAPKKKQGEGFYLTALRSIRFRISLLSAERLMYSDDSEEQESAYELRSLAREESVARIFEKGREMSLRSAMLSAWQWIASQAVQGANAGGDNANVVYTDIVKRLSRTKPSSKTTPGKPVDAKPIIERLVTLRDRSLAMSKYNFMPALRADEIIEVLSSAKPSVLPILQTVLEPYINGQQARILALENIYQITHRFVSTFNAFYKGKRVNLDLGNGMSIINEFDGETLDPMHLSSGEQQLLLLFCHTLVSRARPSIFIIDEPELSLNVKWQRKLVRALLDVSSGSTTQFLFASHSIELLTQHRDKVVELKPAEGN